MSQGRMLPGQNRYPKWKQIPGTYSLILITVFWYIVVESICGKSIVGLMQAGALEGFSVESGEWYRLISAMFVHVSMIHLLLNMISLWSLYLAELLFGTRAFLVLYGVSGIAGNGISVLLMNPLYIAAGASGAVFGIFGAIFALTIQGVLNKTLRNQLILLLAANFIYDLSHPDINILAHLGGFAVGMLFAWFYKRFRLKQKLWTMGAYGFGFLFAFSLMETKFWT